MYVYIYIYICIIYSCSYTYIYIYIYIYLHARLALLSTAARLCLAAAGQMSIFLPRGHPTKTCRQLKGRLPESEVSCQISHQEVPQCSGFAQCPTLPSASRPWHLELPKVEASFAGLLMKLSSAYMYMCISLSLSLYIYICIHLFILSQVRGTSFRAHWGDTNEL